ncbi:hypothetical protein TNCT_344411 [Trichonephila clavata]|uniref:Uncharacterized protein n=1 Tax=Trichonephila clavata TaxID=2740835 RepID=A0A8X6JDW4_TRICU|nr:hypothetical protein TNCT_344411 [Trichonephila clavata]
MAMYLIYLQISGFCPPQKKCISGRNTNATFTSGAQPETPLLRDGYQQEDLHSSPSSFFVNFFPSSLHLRKLNSKIFPCLFFVSPLNMCLAAKARLSVSGAANGIPCFC